MVPDRSYAGGGNRMCKPDKALVALLDVVAVSPPRRPAPPRHSFIQHAGSAPPPAEGCEEMAGGREAKIPPVPSPAAERERRGGGRDRRGRLRVPPARGPQPGQAAGGRFLRRCRGGVLAVQGAAGAVPARRPLGPLPGRDPPQQQRRQVLRHQEGAVRLPDLGGHGADAALRPEVRPAVHAPWAQ